MAKEAAAPEPPPSTPAVLPSEAPANVSPGGRTKEGSRDSEGPCAG